MDNVELRFESAALDAVVDRAVEYKLGARGLRSIMESIMNDIMYEIPSSNGEHKTVVITKKMALDKMNESKLISTL